MMGRSRAMTGRREEEDLRTMKEDDGRGVKTMAKCKDILPNMQF